MGEVEVINHEIQGEINRMEDDRAVDERVMAVDETIEIVKSGERVIARVEMIEIAGRMIDPAIEIVTGVETEIATEIRIEVETIETSVTVDGTRDQDRQNLAHILISIILLETRAVTPVNRIDLPCATNHITRHSLLTLEFLVFLKTELWVMMENIMHLR